MSKYLDFIRKQPCLVCFRTPSDAHHVRRANNSGIGLKPNDRFTIPLCRYCHTEWHNVGEKTFISRYKPNLKIFDEMKKLQEIYDYKRIKKMGAMNEA